MSSTRRHFLQTTLLAVPGLTLAPAAWAEALLAEKAAAPGEFLPPDYSNDRCLRISATITAATVVLQVKASDLAWNDRDLTDTTLRLLLAADLPDGTRLPLGVVTAPYQLTISRQALPAGGWVCFTGEVLVGTHLNKFRTRSYYLGSGTSKAPAAPIRVMSAQLDAGRVDWVAVPSRYPYRPHTPYPLPKIPAQNGVAPTQWVKETPWGPGYHYPESIPRWRRIGGQVQIEATRGSGGTSELGPAAEVLRQFPTYGGPPGVANTIPYATVRGHPSGGHGPMWIELDALGGFWGYNRDGTIIAMAGNRLPADPLDIPDETLSSFRPVGQFNHGPLKHPHDFSFDYVDRKLVYVADSDNHRLVRISRHAASVPGQPEDFSKWVFSAWGAGFAHPTSVEATTDGKLYVVDNQGLWQVNRDTGAKTLLWAQPALFWVRSLSNGQLCLADTAGKIYRFDPATAQVVQLAATGMATKWPVLSIDQHGLIGPRDSAYYVNAANYLVWRIDQDGTVIGPVYLRSNGGYAAQGDIRFTQDTPGHYMWNAEVHPEEPYLFTRGFANGAPWLIRPMQPGESHLSQNDNVLAAAGNMVMRRGTVKGFPWGARPSFTALFSTHGHTGLGIPMFDEIQAMPLAQRIAYVKSGMGGSVARPELVGDHLRSLLYWIWRNSRQFMAGLPADLPPPETDRTVPVITDLRAQREGEQLRITWKTDRPTLCYVRFGDRQPLYRWTPLESSFATTHTALASYTPGSAFYQVCALGANGVLAESAITAVDGPLDTLPPRAPTNLRT